MEVTLDMGATTTGVKDVSETNTDELIPCAVTVSDSVPSVVRSEAIGIVMVAFPLELTIAVPDKAPPVMSAELTPEIV